MTTIYLIRHAEAEGNIYRRAHGQYDSLITPRGLKQIEKLAERMSGERIDAVYSSDLYRARRTAAAIYVPRGLPLVTDKRFREIHMGSWEDLPFGEAIFSEPENTKLLDYDPWKWVAGDSETFAEVGLRFMDGLRKVTARHDGETIAIVSHGMALRSAMCIMLGICGAEDYPKAPQSDNTSVTKVTLDRGAFAPGGADTSHLPLEMSTRHYNRSIRKRFDSELWCLRFRRTGSDAYDVLFGEEYAGCVETDVESDSLAGIITKFELLPRYRGFGLGIQLLGQAVSSGRSAGKRVVRAHLTPDTPAGFFLRSGFADVRDNRFEMNISIEHADDY